MDSTGAPSNLPAGDTPSAAAAPAPEAPAPGPAAPSPPQPPAQPGETPERKPDGPPDPLARRNLAGRLFAPVKRWLNKSEDEVAGTVRPKGAANRSRFTQPRVLFVCTGNTARSQMAEAFAVAYGFHAESAGTFPSMRVQPEAVQAMDEIGIDVSMLRPKPIDAGRLESFDRVVSMGDSLPKNYRGVNVEQWDVLDPNGYPIEGYRHLRDQLEKRIQRMAREFKLKPPQVAS